MISQNKFGDKKYCPQGFVDEECSSGQIEFGDWCDEVKESTSLLPFKYPNQVSSNNYSRLAKEVRDQFLTYFNSKEGEVEWQWAYINRTIDPFDEI